MDFRDISPQIAQVAKSYHYQRPPDIMVLLQDLVERTLRQINDFLASFHILVPQLSDTRSVGDVMKVILILMGAVCVIALIVTVWGRMRHLQLQSQLARKGQSAVETLLDAKGWRAQAAELAGQSKYKEACRALYLSLLRLLDEANVLEFTPTRTNYEYWYALKKHQAVATAFKEMITDVESIWFGHDQADKARYERCLAALSAAETEVQGETERGSVTPKA